MSHLQVYTPDHLRGHGYATHLVVEVTQLLLKTRNKKSVLLSIDLRNTIAYVWQGQLEADSHQRQFDEIIESNVQ